MVEISPGLQVSRGEISFLSGHCFFIASLFFTQEKWVKKWWTLSRLCVWVASSCAWLSDPMDYSLPVFSIHGIL